MVRRPNPQRPRALLRRLRRCRKAGGGVALHAGGCTVAGTRAWEAWVTSRESRAVEAQLCCEYPEKEGLRQELHDTLRSRACLVSLSLAKCMWETLESLMRASRIVAQRVSDASGFSAFEINPLPVAHVCRTGAGLQPPSPIDDRRVTVHWEKKAQGEEGSRTRGVAHDHLPRWPSPRHLPGSLGCGPCRRHVRPQPAALLVSGACDPAFPHSLRQGACGRDLGLVRGSTRRAMRPPSYTCTG
jgi:hypothetical protein